MARLVAESFPVPLVDGLRMAETRATRSSEKPSYRKGTSRR